MNRKILAIIVYLSIICGLWTAEIEIREELRENPSDLTLIRNPKQDYSGRDCALIKISTDLAPFDKIESNQTPVEVQNQSGEVWLYLSEGERRLYFSKDGYARLIYDLPLSLKSNKVYEMKLLGSGVNLSKALPVTVRIDPPDASLEVDGLTYDPTKPVLLEPGSYPVDISKRGYINLREEIVVSSDRVFFEFQLRPQDPVMLTIRSEPDEAEIAIDNVSEGRTNKQIFRFPGNYHLRIQKTGYEPLEREITVSENGDNFFSYQLEKSTVTLSVVLEPADATLLINNQEMLGSSFELAAGQYKLEARKPGYDPVERRIELQKGQNHEERMELIRQFGRLIFTVEPMEAEITLSNGDTWTGSRIMDLPVGEYLIESYIEAYEPEERSFRIDQDQANQLDLVLQKLDQDQTSQVSSVHRIDKIDRMVLVPGGTFTMGDTRGEGRSNELPTHRVTINPFFMNEYEVTQSEWENVMGVNPALDYGEGGNYPVYNVSWYSILKYCNRRSRIERLTPVYSIAGSTNPADWGTVPTSNNSVWNAVICNWNANGYRLPTEAEWEHAARGASNEPDYRYSGSDEIAVVGWYEKNTELFGSKSKPVGIKARNDLGIYDLSGNVWELCWDWYNDSCYDSNPQNNPKGPETGSLRVLRGGYWGSNAYSCRVSYRSSSNPNDNYYDIGFRVCRSTQ